MTPDVLLEIAFFSVEQLLKYAPDLFATFQAAVTREKITVEELQARRQALEAQKFEDLVPNSELPSE